MCKRFTWWHLIMWSNAHQRIAPLEEAELTSEYEHHQDNPQKNTSYFRSELFFARFYSLITNLDHWELLFWKRCTQGIAKERVDILQLVEHSDTLRSITTHEPPKMNLLPAHSLQHTLEHRKHYVFKCLNRDIFLSNSWKETWVRFTNLLDSRRNYEGEETKKIWRSTDSCNWDVCPFSFPLLCSKHLKL